MERIRLTILVHDSWRDRFPEVVDNCERAGVQVERELVSVGIIIGSIDQNQAATLEHIEGVCAVEPEHLNRASGLDESETGHSR